MKAFLLNFLTQRTLLWELTKKDLKQRYLGSYLGILWAFIQPMITVLIFWFVFQVGFKSKPVDDFPFILWLVSGMFPWFFVSDSISSATDAIVSNTYLVKKVVFRVRLLPMMKIIAALLVHFFFVLLLFVMFAIYGYFPSIYSLQVFYYTFSMVVLIIGISWITSSLVVFLKDIGQIVSMLLQFGFWGTPVFWSAHMIPEQYHWLLFWNPAYYIIEGYRNAFIYHRWFWQDGYLTIYYWVFTLIILWIGNFTFKKLRPHFADVL